MVDPAIQHQNTKQKQGANALVTVDWPTKKGIELLPTVSLGREVLHPYNVRINVDIHVHIYIQTYTKM